MAAVLGLGSGEKSSGLEQRGPQEGRRQGDAAGDPGAMGSSATGGAGGRRQRGWLGPAAQAASQLLVEVGLEP